MKNKLKILLIMPFLSMLLANSCKKDDLPKATQTGANTMAAKINGQAWQKKACTSCIGGGSALSINYDDRNFFGVSGEQQDQGITITLVIQSLKTTGTYELTTKGNNLARLYSDHDVVTYYTSNIHKGRVTITKLDITNQIISGTFDFTAEDQNDPNKTISVTDGNFDITYK